jgi:hypothetical protein
LKQEVYEHGFNEHIREVFLGVLEDADVASLSPKEKLIYDASLKRYRDNHACLDYAIETGIKQGIQQGVIGNFASADFRKIKTYNFRKSESY